MTIEKIERRKCDRCEFVSEAISGQGQPDDWVRMSFHDVSRPELPRSDLPAQADFCPDCREALANWLREARRPNVEGS